MEENLNSVQISETQVSLLVFYKQKDKANSFVSDEENITFWLFEHKYTSIKRTEKQLRKMNYNWQQLSNSCPYRQW